MVASVQCMRTIAIQQPHMKATYLIRIYSYIYTDIPTSYATVRVGVSLTH